MVGGTYTHPHAHPPVDPDVGIADFVVAGQPTDERRVFGAVVGWWWLQCQMLAAREGITVTNLASFSPRCYVESLSILVAMNIVQRG